MMLPTIDIERLTADFLCLTTGSAESLDERRVADFLTDQLQSIGFSVSEDDAGHKLGGNTGNLYGYLKGGKVYLPECPFIYNCVYGHSPRFLIVCSKVLYARTDAL